MTPKPLKISCYLIVKNEEERLERTLLAAKQVADEIVVVDSGSTDTTLEIAKRHADKVLHHDWVSYAHQKNYAQGQCTHGWLLSLDADEVLSEALIAEIIALKAAGAPAHAAYNMRIVDVYPGRTHAHRWSRAYNIIRLYDKRRATMRDDLLTEDRIALTGKGTVGQLDGLCEHYSYLKLSQTILKLNKYTDDVMVTVASKKRPKTYGAGRLLVEFPYQFFRYYILRRNFLNGMFGFIVSFNMAYFRWVKVAKLVEAQKLKALR